MNTTGTIDSSPGGLRASMVEAVLRFGHAQSHAVEEALRTVPRHLFVPNAPLVDAYAVETAVSIKDNEHGKTVSCASEPRVVAMMLDQLDVRTGNRVLEIGAGTGYNAALLAELTGPEGHVATIDYDPEVTAHAREALDRNGYSKVDVMTRNGLLGDPDRAPYDRLIVTVGLWDLPTAWRDQLNASSRLVLPLRWRGQTRAVAFHAEGQRLVSDSVQLCGFVPMVGQGGEVTAAIDPGHLVALHWDADQDIDPTRLQGVLETVRTESWTDVRIGPEEPFDGVWLRLTAIEPGCCRIAVDRAAIDSGLCTPVNAYLSPAIVDADSLAYLTVRRHPEDAAERRWELGAIGHGPVGERLAEHLCAGIRDWSHDRSAQPLIVLHPADHEVLDPYAIHKPQSTLTITY